MSTSSTAPADQQGPIAYSYIRFSAAAQQRGDSVRRQLDASRRYAAEHGLRLNETTTIRDLGTSAFKGANRLSGEFGTFLQAVKAGKIAAGSYLLVENFDRLSREKVLNAFSTFVDIINAGIIVVTLHDEVVHSREQYNQSAASLMLSLTKMSQAHEESAKKSVRLAAAWDAKRIRARDGEIATARCPGWLKKQGDAFVQLPERVAIVRRIFDEFVAGSGRGTIARRLNRDSVPPFGHGRGWHGGSVQKVTNNVAVIGRYLPHTVVRSEGIGSDGRPTVSEKRVPIGEPIDGYYPEIIPRELFYRAQAVAANRSRLPGNTGGRKGTVVSNLFAHLATCIVCKRPMVYRDRGPRSSIVLRCSGERTGTCENSFRYPYKALELAVLRWVQELDLGETRSSQIAELETRLMRLKAEQAEFRQSQENLLDAFQNGVRAVQRRVELLEHKIEAIESEVHACVSELVHLRGSITESERKAQFEALIERMNVAEGTELHSIRSLLAQSLRDLFQSMLCHRDGKIRLITKGSMKHYVFTPIKDAISERYITEPLHLIIRSDLDATPDEKALFDRIYEIRDALADDDGTEQDPN
jgi:DNA invertase Pin-like site-specific DNA recombinase